MTSDDKALVPVEQKEVIFYDDEIAAVPVEVQGRRELFIPVRPICDFLEVDWSAQYRRIRRDPVLSEELTPCIVVTATQGQPDQRREVQCLPLDFINGFLFGINAQAVKAIAMQLSKRSGHNEYGGVYGGIYRRFGINSYKELPAGRYDEAINWLNEWLQSLISASPF